MGQKTNKLPYYNGTFTDFINNHPYNTRPHYTEEELGKMKKADRPDLAREQDFMLTLDPNLGYPPPFGLMHAYQQTEIIRSQRGAITGINWTERGPDNVGGRSRALMFDPNDGTGETVFAGGVDGGLWKTTNISSGSPNWTKIDDFWDNIAVTCIAYDPSNTQVFYVGTGEGWYNVDAVRGAGIWKTTNGGSTWTQLSSTATDVNFDYVNKIVVNSAGKVFAATSSQYTNRGGLMMSSDGGSSWSKFTGDGSSPDWAADVEVAANGDLYASFGVMYSDGIYKSTNGGTSWSLSYSNTSVDRIELACAPSNSNVVYALLQNGSSYAIYQIRKTTNGGSSWTNLTLPDWHDQGSCSSTSTDFTRQQAWYDLIAAVDPNNENRVFIGGVDIMLSNNGGSSWSQISNWANSCYQYVHADIHAILYWNNSSNKMIFGCDGGVFYTANGSASTPTISEKNTGYNVTQFYACDISPTSGSNNFIAGAQDNGTQKFTNPGMNSTTEIIGGDGAFCFIDDESPNSQIGSYTYNYYYATTNNWSSGSQISANSNGSFINPAELHDRDNILYSCYSTTKLQRIKNVFTSPSTATITISGMGSKATHIKVSPYSPLNQSTLFVGCGNGDLFKVTNAQASPSSTNITGSWSGSVSCVAVGASENQLLVTLSNYGVTSVWQSTDGGSSWVNKEGNLPDMPIRWAMYNPLDYTQVLLATEVGVWSTTDITASSVDWGPTNGGLANVRVDMLKLRPADNTIIAATHGRGLFSTTIGSCTSPTISLNTQTNASCNSVCDGAIDINVTGGSTPYSYSWSNSATTQDVSGLCAGAYTVTVTENGGCTETASYTITEPTAIDLSSTSSTNESCSGNDGTATVNPSGGSAPYTYLWSTSQTTQTITGLTQGTYTVTVTDNNPCTNTTTVTVNKDNCIPNTKLKTPYCPITLVDLDDLLKCDMITGATNYRYRAINGTDTLKYTRPIGDNKFKMTWLNPYPQPNKTYDIQVKAYMGGWGSYGTVCQVTTPGSLPTTELKSQYCPITLVNMKDNLYCNPVYGAQKYRYRAINGQDTSYYTRWWASALFHMNWLIPQVQTSTTYDVQVCVKSGGVWGPYGSVCQVTTAPSFRLGHDMNTNEDIQSNISSFGSGNYEVLAYPNPSKQNQSIDIEIFGNGNSITPVQVYLYDVFGNIVSSENILYSDGGIVTRLNTEGKLAKGLYLLKIIIDDETLQQKLTIY